MTPTTTDTRIVLTCEYSVHGDWYVSANGTTIRVMPTARAAAREAYRIARANPETYRVG